MLGIVLRRDLHLCFEKVTLAEIGDGLRLLGHNPRDTDIEEVRAALVFGRCQEICSIWSGRMPVAAVSAMAVRDKTDGGCDFDSGVDDVCACFRASWVGGGRSPTELRQSGLPAPCRIKSPLRFSQKSWPIVSRET